MPNDTAPFPWQARAVASPTGWHHLELWNPMLARWEPSTDNVRWPPRYEDAVTRYIEILNEDQQARNEEVAMHLARPAR